MSNSSDIPATPLVPAAFADLGGGVNRGPELLPIYWTQFGIAFIFVILRFYARSTIRAIGWDDWIIAAAMLLDAAATIVQTILVNQYPLVSIGHENMTQALSIYELYYILQPLTTMAVAIGRMSVATLLLRLLGPNLWTRYFLYFSIGSTLLLSSLYSVLIFVQCSPVGRLWDPTIPGSCWSTSITPSLAIVTCGWNALMDICLALVPIITFSRLHMKRKKKVGLCTLMSLGVIASIAAAIKAWKYLEIETPDFTWTVFDLFAVSGVELLLIIVCACVPTLKPLYDQWFKRVRIAKRNQDLFLSNQPIHQPIQSDFQAVDGLSDRSTTPVYSRETNLPSTSKGSYSLIYGYTHV